jgi:hypothetical protein
MALPDVAAMIAKDAREKLGGLDVVSVQVNTKISNY